ncbi:hypothetical protein Peur_017379 [Populus x canadensis]
MDEWHKEPRSSPYNDRSIHYADVQMKSYAFIFQITIVIKLQNGSRKFVPRCSQKSSLCYSSSHLLRKPYSILAWTSCGVAVIDKSRAMCRGPSICSFHNSLE